VSVLAKEFSGFLVDEMEPGAGETDDGHIRIGLVLRRGLRKPMLHVGAQPWAFEKNMSAHSREYAEPSRRVTSVRLRSWGCPETSGGGEKKRNAGTPIDAALPHSAVTRLFWRLQSRRGKPRGHMQGRVCLAGPSQKRLSLAAVRQLLGFLPKPFGLLGEAIRK
jgi:hypothetical protein